MSIQSSINQMLSSIANDKLYENIYKSLKNTETNIGGIEPELTKLQKQIRRSNQRQATERYKQAIAAGIAQNQGTPQLAPDNTPETPKSEDTPWTVDETPTYYAVEASPEEQAQINKLKKQYGNLDEAFKIADIGQTIIGDEIEARKNIPDFDDVVAGVSNMVQLLKNTSQVRVNMEQNLARRTNETVAQRLQKAKAERSQSKQEFLKNKGGKHR